eukprot:TRINITY_DN107110_c0_g1_i1.p1 TRINITY_DN107110_c0_g1~~TRINITY_DN107110_c0_g1_i1.p1  ORF type:complete len:2085 (+),score=494.69 TRINITY_DN107110_c0_g1_i1:699-6257(+)
MLERALQRLGAEQYGRMSHFFEELLQNADDCQFSLLSGSGRCCPTLQLHAVESASGGELQSLTFWHNEDGLTERDVRALCDVGRSTKATDAEARRTRTGCKGVGFKSVFLVTARPLLFSRGGRFSFCFEGGTQLGCVLPQAVNAEDARREAPPWLPHEVLERGTMLHLPLLSGLQRAALGPVLRPPVQLLLFLRRLRELHVLQGCARQPTEVFSRRLLRLEDVPWQEGLPSSLKRRSMELVEESHSSSGVPNVHRRQRFSWLVYRHCYAGAGDHRHQLELAFLLDAGQQALGDLAMELHEGADVFCTLPVQRAGLPFVLNAEDLELTTARGAVREDSQRNLAIRDQALQAALAAHAACEEVREVLLRALGPRLRSRKGAKARDLTQDGENGRVEGGDAVEASPCSFFEPLVVRLLAHLRSLPSLRSESGQWCRPCDLRLRPVGSALLFSNDLLQSSIGLQFAAEDGAEVNDGLGRQELLRLGVQHLMPKELLTLLRAAFCDCRGEALERPEEWFQQLYAFLCDQQHELSSAGLLPNLRALQGLVRVVIYRAEDEAVNLELSSLSGAEEASPRLFLSIGDSAGWPIPELQQKELKLSGALRLVAHGDFASVPRARRFLELQGVGEASLQDCAIEIARRHWRGDFGSVAECWAGLRYLCRAWPRLEALPSEVLEELRSALCCPCEDGTLRPLSEVHVRSFLGEACSECAEPPREVCGTLPPQLDDDAGETSRLAQGLLDVRNTFRGRELHCSAAAACGQHLWAGVRSSCGVVSGRWYYEVHIEAPDGHHEPGHSTALAVSDSLAGGSIAMGWASKGSPLCCSTPAICADSCSVLLGGAGWLSAGKDIIATSCLHLQAGWTVRCFVDATAGWVHFEASSSRPGSHWRSPLLQLPQRLRGMELWPLLRLRRGACARVSFAGVSGRFEDTDPLADTWSAAGVDLDTYSGLAQACSVGRASASQRAKQGQQPGTSLVALEAADLPQDPLLPMDRLGELSPLDWEVFLAGLGAKPHWDGCRHRHRWFSALDMPLAGDCPLCLAPLAEAPEESAIDATKAASAGAASVASALAVGLPCEHKFHSACIFDLALVAQRTGRVLHCPVCRAPFHAQELVELAAPRGRRAERLSALLSSCLGCEGRSQGAQASGSQAKTGEQASSKAGTGNSGTLALMRSYVHHSGCLELLRRICLPTSRGRKPIEECFITGPSLRSLRARAGPEILAYVTAVAPKLLDLAAACGAICQLDATGALQALRGLRLAAQEGHAEAASPELAAFLYTAVAENAVLVEGESHASMLRALASEELILAPKPGDQPAYVKLARCVWDGPRELAAVLELHGPLCTFYGDSQLLRELFLQEPLSTRCFDARLCAAALRRLAAAPCGLVASAQVPNSLPVARELGVAAAYAQLEDLLTDGDATAVEAMAREEWWILCRRVCSFSPEAGASSQLMERMQSVGLRQSTPHEDEGRDLVFHCDDAMLGSVFSDAAWLLPGSWEAVSAAPSPAAASPSPPPKLLEVLRRLPHGVQSLKACAKPWEEGPCLLDELGTQPGYEAAAQGALLSTLGEGAPVPRVAACNSAYQWHGLITLPGATPTWRRVPLCYVVQSKPETRVVLSYQLPHWVGAPRPFTPQEVVKALAAALVDVVEAFEALPQGRSKEQLEASLLQALNAALPAPPPLQLHREEQEPEVQQQVQEQPRNEPMAHTSLGHFHSPNEGPVPMAESRAPGAPEALLTAALQAAEESQPSASSSSGSVQPDAGLEVQVARGLSEIERGLQTLREALSASRSTQATSIGQQLEGWRPPPMLQNFAAEASSEAPPSAAERQLCARLKADMQPLLREAAALMQKLEERSQAPRRSA